MSQISREAVEQALDQWQDPYLGCSLVAAGAVQDVRIDGQRVAVDISLGFAVDRHRPVLERAVQQAVKQGTGAEEVAVTVSWEIAVREVQATLKPLEGIKNIIAVASAKGGVGKSTTTANLALALAAEGASVGVLDADIYGPSQPRMLGVQGTKPESPDGKSIKPVTNHGLQVMSIGFLVEEQTPMVWRGPMVTQALTQLLTETRWETLDYLIVDLPPGTGDIQLTLSQRVPLSGAVIVTTPQDIALMDARKGLKMFEKVNVPVLGIVENMSIHICSQCGHEEHVFGEGGGERLAREEGVAVLGSLPLDIAIREQADGGTPSVAAEPDGRVAELYREAALRMAAQLSLRDKVSTSRFPNIQVGDD